MNKHRQVLATIIDELTILDPDCSIILAGSMGRGEEQDGSDIDMFVCFSREPKHFSDLIRENNRNRWHSHTEREGISIDIGWNLLDSLPDEIPEGTEMVPYVFVRANIVRDPSGKVGRWVKAMRLWLERNRWIEQEWSKQYEEMLRHKKDPSFPLKYDEQEFKVRLKELIAQRKAICPQPTPPCDVAKCTAHEE